MTDAPPEAVRRLEPGAEDEGLRLDQFIARRLPDLSRSRAQRLIKDGLVRVARRPAKASLVVEPGLEIEVRLPPAEPATPEPEALPLTILHDDEDLVVVDKPAGMVVHPAAGHARGTLVNALLHHVSGLSGIGGRERPGVVHRLDRGTSGLMVIAKHDQAHRALARQFQERQVEKEYVALVLGRVRAGLTMQMPVGRDRRNRKKMSSRSERARPASSTIVDAEPLDGVTLVRVRIGTGRTHQIRVHLSESGHPVAGDELYGGVRKVTPPRLSALARLTRPFLHAARLGFAHPRTGARLMFESPLPADLAAVVEALRTAAAGHPGR